MYDAQLTLPLGEDSPCFCVVAANPEDATFIFWEELQKRRRKLEQERARQQLPAPEPLPSNAPDDATGPLPLKV